MDTKLFFTVIFVLVTFVTTAQSKFAIYHTNGPAYILSGSQSVKAERGKTINKANSLQLKLNASVMLIDSLGKSLLMNKAGTFSFNTLLQMLKNSGKENVSSEFYAYIYENFKKEKKPDVQRVLAIVQRGHPLMRIPLDSIIITDNKVMFNWSRVSDKITMELIVKSYNEAVFDTTIKKSTSLLLDVSSLLPAGKLYRWKTDEAGTTQPSERYYSFLLAEKKDWKLIRKQIKEIDQKNLAAKAKFELQKELLEYWTDKYSASAN